MARLRKGCAYRRLERPYTRHTFTEWFRDHKKNDVIARSIKNIGSILEQRINKGGMTGDLNAKLVEFNLKNNADSMCESWKDKREEIVTTITDNVDLTKLEKNEIEAYIKLREKACGNQH